MLELIDYEPWLPNDGFLRRYCDWTAGHEGPLRFHFWTAATLLSAAIGRRYYVDKGYYKVYPNLYTLLVAPTGKCRKTSSTRVGMELLARSDVRILSTKITPEELIYRLESTRVAGSKALKNAEGFLYASELTVFLGKQTYNEGLIDLLTDFADAPGSWSYASRGGGKVELQNVCLVLLACSTAEWLGEAIPQRAYTGGFLARIIFVVQQQTSRYYPLPMAQDEALREKLKLFLSRIRETTGEFTFTADGLAWYERWYRENRDTTDFEDLRLNGYYERRPDHALRVAMLLAIAEQLPLELTAELLDRAVQILMAIEPDMPAALQQINLSSAGRESLRLLQIITAAKEYIAHADLVRAAMTFMSARLVEESIMNLKAANKITELITPMGRAYALRDNGTPPAEDEIS